MLKLKMQCTDHLRQRADSLEKDPDAGRDGKQKGKAAAEDETVGWHHRLSGLGSEQTPGDLSEDRGAWCAAVRGAAKA